MTDWRTEETVEALRDYAFPAVVDEARFAAHKHGWSKTPANPEMFDHAKFIVVAEEIGEIARALTYDEGDPNNLRDEVKQAATMLLMWYVSLLD